MVSAGNKTLLVHLALAPKLCRNLLDTDDCLVLFSELDLIFPVTVGFASLLLEFCGWLFVMFCRFSFWFDVTVTVLLPAPPLVSSCGPGEFPVGKPSRELKSEKVGVLVVSSRVAVVCIDGEAVDTTLGLPNKKLNKEGVETNEGTNVVVVNMEDDKGRNVVVDFVVDVVCNTNASVDVDRVSELNGVVDFVVDVVCDTNDSVDVDVVCGIMLVGTMNGIVIGMALLDEVDSCEIVDIDEPVVVCNFGTSRLNKDIRVTVSDVVGSVV